MTPRYIYLEKKAKIFKQSFYFIYNNRSLSQIHRFKNSKGNTPWKIYYGSKYNFSSTRPTMEVSAQCKLKYLSMISTVLHCVKYSTSAIDFSLMYYVNRS